MGLVPRKSSPASFSPELAQAIAAVFRRCDR
jgi:hypothetical protein